MQERAALSPAQINGDLLHFALKTPRQFWIALGVLGAIVLAGVVSEGFIVVLGLQLLGLTNTVYWSVFIANFVFWVGISHAGVMISAILRLVYAEWRRPITRCAEVLTIFALATAGLFPLIHTGRVWRTIYWVFPYDFTRNVWPDVRSALIWDPSAIVTYLIGTILFVYSDLLPDLANARDRSAGFRRRVYAVLSLGFRGTVRQWRLQTIAGILLASLILPVFVSVHSIVSWDFSMAILPGWHSTIFAPYFVIGAIHSGVAGVVTVMVLVRRFLRLEDYIRPEHFDAVGRLQVVVAASWLFFFLMDFYFGIFSREAAEIEVWNLRLFTPPYSALLLVMIITGYLIPVPLWLFRRCRRSVRIMFWTSLAVNVALWIERYMLVITPLSYKEPFTFTWVTAYKPQPVEYIITAAAVALVLLGLLVFAKLFPIVPVWAVKEGQVLRREVRIGRVTVPAVAREKKY